MLKCPTEAFLVFVFDHVRREPLFQQALVDAITEMRTRSYAELEKYLQDFLKRC